MKKLISNYTKYFYYLTIHTNYKTDDVFNSYIFKIFLISSLIEDIFTIDPIKLMSKINSYVGHVLAKILKKDASQKS